MNQQDADKLFLDIALRAAKQSHAKRLKVGAVIEKDGNILSFGWNGTPPGEDNTCEELVDGQLVTKWNVRHAELNALSKLLRQGTSSIEGATMYVTHSPCKNCAQLIESSGIVRVVYGAAYRDSTGVDWLTRRGVFVDLLERTEDGL